MRRLDQCFNCSWRRSEIRIAGAKIDDVYTSLQQLSLACGDVRERVHGKGLEAIGELGQFILRPGVRANERKYAPSPEGAHSAVSRKPHTVWRRLFAVPALCPLRARS
jgi:hypothetical protein